MTECIFCKIANGQAPCHRVWEDEKLLAFLTIYPNTPGVSVVITKEHYPSYVFDLPKPIMLGLMGAAKEVGRLLDARFEDVGRTGLIAEGFGVDHAHLKLFPMHGTKLPHWRPIESGVNKYFEQYEGYLSSHDYKRADDEELKKLAAKIRGE